MLWIFMQFMPTAVFGSKGASQEPSSNRAPKQRSRCGQTALSRSAASPQNTRTTEEWNLRLMSHTETHP